MPLIKRYDRTLTITSHLRGASIGKGRASVSWGVFDGRPFFRVGPVVVEYVRNANR